MLNPALKLKIFFWSLLTLSFPLLAQEVCNQVADTPSSSLSPSFFQSLVEIKVGYFSLSDAPMRQIYDKGVADVQLCASYPLHNLTPQWTLNAYCAVEYFYRSGQSINECQKTSMRSVPINIGLKPVYKISATRSYYFAMGPRYFYIQQRNDSSYVYRSRSRNGLGFFANTGFNQILRDHFVIDIFAEYSYAKTHFDGGNACIYTRNTQIGGLTFGLGLGYQF